ncbi:uncharacterized protein LOC131935278 [Physella acuta]|uniref:uncharacterized protein LOC131935278 n=1 Tax=Physella acuta TaxID=109671 RepID=UPI0027DE3BDB|nr:uncharacterized protein LOC131935278 [Physella acuta]
MDPNNNMDKWVTEPEFVEEGDEAQRRGYNLHKDMKHCGKNDQHLNFIPFKFFLGKESTVFKVIEILGNLTVRISALNKQRIKLNASGMLIRLVEVENLDYGRDCCLFFVIITAKHVISNDSEAISATVEFFNDGDNRCDSNSARCIKLLASNNEGDFSEVLCMTTDRILAAKIKNLLDFNHFKLAHRENLFNIFIESSTRKLNNPFSQPESDLNTFKEINNLLQHIDQFGPKEQLLDCFTHPVRFDFRNIEQLYLNTFLFEVMFFCQSNGICTRNVTTEIELLDRVFKNSQERKTVITLVENLSKRKMTNQYIHICYPCDKSKQVSCHYFMSMHNTPTCSRCYGGAVFIIPRECLELNDDGEIQLDKILVLQPSNRNKLSSMAEKKKRKIDDECRQFQEEWNLKYFFIKSGDKALCLICNETVAVMKEYNLRRHHQSKHQGKYAQLEGKVRAKTYSKLKNQLTSQRTLINKSSNENEALKKASYNVAYVLAKSGKPFTDGEVVKECLMKLPTVD